jgi:hypothetical protein
MLEREPTLRWTAAQLLAHPWLCSSTAGNARARLNLAPFVAEHVRREQARFDAHGGSSRDLDLDWSHDLERAS